MQSFPACGAAGISRIAHAIRRIVVDLTHAYMLIMLVICHVHAERLVGREHKPDALGVCSMQRSVVVTCMPALAMLFLLAMPPGIAPSRGSTRFRSTSLANYQRLEA